jgi:hypothetical protein
LGEILSPCGRYRTPPYFFAVSGTPDALTRITADAGLSTGTLGPIICVFEVLLAGFAAAKKE